jgi:hypothetical protein
MGRRQGVDGELVLVAAIPPADAPDQEHEEGEGEDVQKELDPTGQP